ncbi:MAG: hypothetical protein HC859_03355, partial [Bacteroidia bacterium]|nr:hypothetical protein [Bacteroidia bacterium]
TFTTEYFEDFDSGPGTWVTNPAITNSSWLFGNTGGNVITPIVPGANMWWTGANTNVDDKSTYYNNEQSEVIGPCLDITALQRPCSRSTTGQTASSVLTARLCSTQLTEEVHGSR